MEEVQENNLSNCSQLYKCGFFTVNFLNNRVNLLPMNSITQDTLIGEIVDQHPEVVETLLSFGVHCIGCQVSPYESLGDGLRNHGLGEQEIQEALQKLNTVAKPAESEVQNDAAEAHIIITPLAVEKIKAFCSRQQKQALRVAVQPGGCSGYQYQMELTDSLNPEDLVFEEDNAKVVIDQKSIELINGATLDYEDTLTDAGFKIQNPQAHGTCGCGNSFS